MTLLTPILPDDNNAEPTVRNVAIFNKDLPVIDQIRETPIGDAIIIPTSLRKENTVRNAATRASDSGTARYVVQKAFVVTRVS